MSETLDYVKMFALLPAALWRFSRHSLTLPEAQETIRLRMEQREGNFLQSAQRSALASPDKLRDGILKHLAEDSAVAAELARVYLAANTWDPNGSLTPDRIEYTLQLLRKGNILGADLQVADVADLSYLNAVLTEMGRQ